MKLENVDLKQIRRENLPKFQHCPCELCDDGCFDRAKLKHQPDCKRQLANKRTENLTKQSKCPLTHYQMTFRSGLGIDGQPEDHRRSICPPPPENHIPISFPNYPMNEVSSQREHFQNPGPTEPRKPSKPSTDNLKVNHLGSMQTKTQYQLEYIPKPVEPIKFQQIKNPKTDSNAMITNPNSSITSQTTNRNHFKSWQSSPAHPFAELPPVAGHVLFPNSKRRFSTSTGSVFIAHQDQTRQKPIFRLENNGNLRIAGSMDLRTNYQADYVPHRMNSARSAPGNLKTKELEAKVYFRRPMNEISQTRSDFRSYPDHRPPQAVEMPTFSSQFKIGSSSKLLTKKSQYRSDYEGIDTSQHTRPPLAGQNENQRIYIPPVQKMETKTVTQRDFPALDIKNLPRNRLVPIPTNISVNDNAGPMENVTMSRHHFQPYESVQVRRYGDPLPQIYVPSSSKFDGRTTNGETFQGRPGQPARLHVSEVKIVSTTAKFDHNTNYKLDFHPHGLTICAGKAHVVLEQRDQRNSTDPLPAH